MRGPKPNYSRDGRKGSGYGPPVGEETPGNPYPDPGPPPLPCIGSPTAFCVNGLETHIQATGEIWISPELVQAVPLWAPNRWPSYFRIVLDNGLDPPINSGNIAFSDVWKIPGPATCSYISPDWLSAAPITMELWVGNSCGEDFCQTFIIIWDFDGVCP